MTPSKKIYWVAQFSGWLVYAILLLMAAFANNPNGISVHLVINLFILIVVSISCTHILRLLYLRFGWLDLKLPAILPRLLFVSFITAVFIELFTKFISIIISPSEINTLSILGATMHVLAIFVLLIFWNALYFTFHYFQKANVQELQNIRLVALKNEMELKNLVQQLNPHFLFNSLNSIGVLIDLEPAKARKAIVALSALLRQVLTIGKEKLVLVADELQMVENYLELEKIRFEDRLQVEWKLSKDAIVFYIPPFSIQTLVENALKHGVSNQIKGGVIRIETDVQSHQLVITISNSGKFITNAAKGIGIENTRKRLQLQFQEKAHLEITEKDGFVVARLVFIREKSPISKTNINH